MQNRHWSQTILECINRVLSVTFRRTTVLDCFHASWSSTYMKKVNDFTDWLSQTTDISKYFVWYPGLWDKESRLYMYAVEKYMRGKKNDCKSRQVLLISKWQKYKHVLPTGSSVYNVSCNITLSLSNKEINSVTLFYVSNCYWKWHHPSHRPFLLDVRWCNIVFACYKCKKYM